MTNVIDISPDGRDLSSGTTTEPTDSDVTVELPVGGRLSLIVNVSGEVGLKLMDGEARVFPTSSEGSGGFLFRSNWPSRLPAARVEAGELEAVWRNISGGAVVTVEGAAVVEDR